jgi:hydroxypyruvate reductase
LSVGPVGADVPTDDPDATTEAGDSLDTAADLSTQAGVREVTRRCLEAGIAAVDPRRVVHERLSLDGDDLVVSTHDAGGRATGDEEASARYDLSQYDRLLVVGGGKAADGLARGLVDLLGDRIDDGAVVTTNAGAGDHGDDSPARATAGPVRVLPGDHPTPSDRGVESTGVVLDLADGATDDDLVVVLLTGGGSALLAAPAPGLALDDLQQTTDALLASGADIGDINAVRKHLSALKGGQLARRVRPATVLGLAISDVVGDDPATIASGPTAPDPTTFQDARGVLDRHGIDAPAAVRERLQRGIDGAVPETPKPGDALFEGVVNHVLANGHTAMAAARETAAESGPDVATCLLTGRLRGEASVVGQTLAGVAEEVAATGNPLSPPAVVVAGGETTVTVTGDGVGGPNGDLALAAAIEFADWSRVGGETPVALGSVDTDGRDGSTDAAGALVGPKTVGGEDDKMGPAASDGDDRTAVERAREALADDDSHGYLGARDALVVTGATGTNVDDIVVVVVGDPAE